MNGKIGCAILTYNAEGYFSKLFHSIPRGELDELVVINGGNPYNYEYENCHWIQHTENKFPSVCRNDAIEKLLELGCEHIFLIEDDMIVLDGDIFQKYIEASQKSGLKYLWHVSTSDGSGERGKRTPRIIIDYPNGQKIPFYSAMCNEFTYHHASVFETLTNRPYDENMKNAFDVELTYRESKMDHSAPFWYFPDIPNSDNYITNNPDAVSRLQANGERERTIGDVWKYFSEKHNIQVRDIPKMSESGFRAKLKQIYKNRILPDYDIFIPCTHKDWHKLPYVIESCNKFTKARGIYVCAPGLTKEMMESIPKSVIPVEFVMDENVFPYDRSKIGFRPNWTYQQFLKMFQTVTPSEWYLTLDADTILMKPLSVFDIDDRPKWFYGWEQFHPPYFSVMTDLGIRRSVDHTCIGDIGFFNRSHVNALLKYVRCNSGKQLMDMIVGSFNSIYHFSEFETYGNFVEQEYFGHYAYKKLEQRNMGKWLDKGEENWTVDEIEQQIKASSGNCDVLNLHSWKI